MLALMDFCTEANYGGLLVWYLQKYLSVYPRRLKSFDDEGMSEVSRRGIYFGFYPDAVHSGV
ncbi:hypothetical protein NOF04DRAFT_1334205 [Fusarium oxysporum II5]|nr:hypothetical protein NOF04DRAFT_1334205 [Fusarium oxysporum II5]